MHGTRDVSSIKFPFRQLPAHISAWAWIATCSGPGEGKIEISQDFLSFFFSCIGALFTIFTINSMDQSDSAFDRFAGARGIETIPATETS
jgi:hypothetical protein